MAPAERSNPASAPPAVYHELVLGERALAFLDHLKKAFPQGTPEKFAAYIGV